MDHSNATIAFIGGGNMARALLAGLLRAGHQPAALHVADPDPAQRERLRELSAGLGLSGDNVEVAAAAEMIVLAVKPQLLPGVARSVAPRAAAQLVVSVAAGVSPASPAGTGSGPASPASG